MDKKQKAIALAENIINTAIAINNIFKDDNIDDNIKCWLSAIVAKCADEQARAIQSQPSKDVIKNNNEIRYMMGGR